MTMTTDKSRADALTDLLPCPHCGHAAQIMMGTGPFGGRVQVECASCRIATFWFEEAVAVRMWNRRVAASPVEQPAPITARDALDAIETFEIVGENNDSREPNSADRFILNEFIAHLFGGYRVDRPSAAPIDEPRANGTITFSGDSLTLSGAQLLEALDFVAPDRDRDQLESELTFQRGEGHSGNGTYCWLTEYPEEGAIFNDGSTVVPAAAPTMIYQVFDNDKFAWTDVTAAEFAERQPSNRRIVYATADAAAQHRVTITATVRQPYQWRDTGALETGDA